MILSRLGGSSELPQYVLQNSAVLVVVEFFRCVDAQSVQSADPSAAVPEESTSPNTGSMTTLMTDRSIAVLPFADMSEKQDQGYFADGMTEEVVNLLTKVPGIRVIGRTACSQFKGKSEDMRRIGSVLGAVTLNEVPSFVEDAGIVCISLGVLLATGIMSLHFGRRTS